MALQAWDMLHGNPLLRHWHMSDVSFWSTELMQDALLEAVHGLGPGVVHPGGAITYTLLLTPDHLGSAVPVLLAWLAVDRLSPSTWPPT